MNRIFGSATVIMILLFFTGCNDAEIGSAKDINADAIYFDYRITGEEGNDDATALLQYRFGGRMGTTLTIEAPGKVELDGESIRVDSSRMTGAFYELQKPVKQFAGEHTIRFTNMDKKVYEEKFSFPYFTLAGGLPDTVSRQQLEILFSGLKDGDMLNISLSDTSYTGDGVLRKSRLTQGKLVISADDLGKLAGGPIQFEVTREMERPVKKGTHEGGKIVVAYTIRKEFWLKD